MDRAQLLRYLGVIRRACDLIEEQLPEEAEAAFREVESSLPNPAPAAVVEQPKNHLPELLAMSDWPAAIPQFRPDTALTDEDHVNRANAVLDTMLARTIEGQRVLDYGCGDGYVTSQMEQRGAGEVVGFDVQESPLWRTLKSHRVWFTDRAEKLSPGAYDVVFLYDVLDHATDPEAIMAHVRDLCRPEAVVYIRCHPWTSRHASHLPKFGLNKAYIHLFVEPTELARAGHPPLFTRVEKDPMTAYRWWFRHFAIHRERPYYEEVHEFFRRAEIKRMLGERQGFRPADLDGFLDRMRLQYVTYNLGLTPCATT